jgi:hypothetical protein
MKKTANLILLMASILVQQSCSSIEPITMDPKHKSPSMEVLILGKWYQEQFVFEGQEPNTPNEYEFTSDGRFTYRTRGRYRSGFHGTWKISDSRLMQSWSNFESLEGVITNSSIFVLNESHLELENIKKIRDKFYRQPKIRQIPRLDMQ